MVARRTGLSPHVIRAWEKRYGTVRPQRSVGNQRVYTEEDIQRLALLKQATDDGHSIGNVTHLPIPQLQNLLSRSTKASTIDPPRDAGQLADAAYDAVTRLDPAGLEQVLEEGAVSMGQGLVLSRVVAPLVQRIGDEWRRGALKIAHEHFASAVIRTFLGRAARPMGIHAAAPVLLATTPAGQLHEIGAALAAAVASSLGWRVIYMGPSLPAEEIVAAVRQNNVQAVALSIVHPEDDPHLPDEILRLRRLLPPDTRLIVGGRAVDSYRETLSAIGATICKSLDDLTAALELLRQRSR